MECKKIKYQDLKGLKIVKFQRRMEQFLYPFLTFFSSTFENAGSC
jgi:hypothetical protein